VVLGVVVGWSRALWVTDLGMVPLVA
jgi:hypothetical protein